MVLRPGVQHVALLGGNVIETVTRLKTTGVESSQSPTATTPSCPRAVGTIDEPMEELQKLGILVDRDEEGYLLQIFIPSRCRIARRCVFEILQRKGARGFGKGNFKRSRVDREGAGEKGNL